MSEIQRDPTEEMSKYRPIPLIPTLSKIFEKFVLYGLLFIWDEISNLLTLNITAS